MKFKFVFAKIKEWIIPIYLWLEYDLFKKKLIEDCDLSNTLFGVWIGAKIEQVELHECEEHNRARTQFLFQKFYTYIHLDNFFQKNVQKNAFCPPKKHSHFHILH